MTDHAKRLAEFAANLRFENLPEAVVEKVRLFLADYYAAGIAGYQVNRVFNQAVLELIHEDGGIGQSSVLFDEGKYPAANAAFMNAVYTHGADMDDGNRLSAGHIGTSVISSVFAVAETLNVLWNDVFVAIVIGYEFFNRIAGAAQPDLYQKGFHSTGVAGSMACAAACAKLLGLDQKGIYNSVSLAAVQSSGLLLIDESNQSCKPINPANAARIGVLSARLALKRVEGPNYPLDSQKGWFHAFSDNPDCDILLDGLGSQYTICDSYIKLYPACRHTHCCIDAALALREKLFHGGPCQIREIEKIEIAIYPNAIRSAGEIGMPKSEEEAKFSIRYAFAVALFKGRFGLEELIPQQEKAIADLIERIELLSDSGMEDRSKGIRGAKVTVSLSNGDVFVKEVLIPKGEGTHALNWCDMKEKMAVCASQMMSRKESDALAERCQEIRLEDPFTWITI